MDAISLEQSKSLTQYNPPTDLLLSKTDPVVFASRIGEGMRAGVRSVIGACVLLFEADRLFDTDPRLLDQFFLALVDENVIPKRSARLGNVGKSKFSMLRKIGKHADLLLDDGIFRFLESGYSVLYHVILLYEALPGDHQYRLARLHALAGQRIPRNCNFSSKHQGISGRCRTRADFRVGRTLRKALGFNAASVLDDSSLGHWIAVVRECFLD
jgi:hypothetical protein